MAKRKSRKPSTGLGDTIEKITEATGIKKVVEMFTEATGLDCGCDARKEKLNELFPYKKPECLTKDEYEFLGGIFGKSRIKSQEQSQINTIYNRVFHDKVKQTGCAPCLSTRINQLHQVYDTYEAEN
jgi:hypothetical protein